MSCKSGGYPSGNITAVSNYKVVLLIGQSNMVGRYGPISSTLDYLDGRIAQWGRLSSHANEICLAADPLEHVTQQLDSVGMGLTYAKSLLATLPSDVGVLLVPCAQDGTGFSDNRWNPGDDLYEAAIARALAALNSKSGNLLHSILWHQGERDMAYTQTQYANALDAMVNGLRSRLSDANLPFICGGTLVGGTMTATGVTNALIDTPNRLNYTGYADPTSLTSGGDNLHFSAASQRTFGGRYFTAYGDALLNT